MLVQFFLFFLFFFLFLEMHAKDPISIATLPRAPSPSTSMAEESQRSKHENQDLPKVLDLGVCLVLLL